MTSKESLGTILPLETSWRKKVGSVYGRVLIAIVVVILKVNWNKRSFFFFIPNVHIHTHIHTHMHAHMFTQRMGHVWDGVQWLKHPTSG